MRSRLIRSLILALLISVFVAVASALTALITSLHTYAAWKIAIALCGYCISVVPLASLLLLRRISRTALTRTDGFITAVVSMLVMPLPIVIYSRVVPLVTGHSFPELGVRLLAAAVIICTIVGIFIGLGLTRRGQPLSGA